MKQDIHMNMMDTIKILPSIRSLGSGRKTDKEWNKVEPEFKYSSDTNKSWMKTEDLSDWIKINSSEIGKI